MMKFFRASFLALLAFLTLAPVIAQEQAERAQRSEQRAARPSPNGEGVLRLLPPDSVSEKTINLSGQPLTYTATAGTLSLYDQNGERTAAVFYTSYVAKGADVARRPITFVFNGGPGAASAFLHLGLAGPRVVDFGPEGRDGAAAKLVDNPDTWLTFTDLVMIDPVGTGWSRPAKPDGGGTFWGVRRDAESIAKVIALYVANNNRMASPKYLMGESYGGFRAAKVARTLQDEQGIVVSGIVMVSPMLEGAFQWGGSRFALGAALNFPSLVATELERTKQFTPEAMAEAERFARTEYLTTLAGPPPVGDKANSFYRKIAEMTGLPPETVARSRGYIRGAYLQHLRSTGHAVSSYDATFAVPDPFPESDGRRGVDPILDGFVRALSGAFVGYARDELGFKTEISHLLLNREISGKWDWGGGREPAGVSDDLRVLLALVPSFRLLVSHGRSDLVTPYGVSRYVLDSLPPTVAGGRVQLKLHPGGHMFYFNREARHTFTREAREFFEASPNSKPSGEMP
jgi:carboxypeptidase C (cathepsin A)